MADVKSTYQRLIAEIKQISLLGSCAGVLGWDKQTYMPKGGAGHRAEQLALLVGMIHERATAPQIGDYLEEIENSDLNIRPPFRNRSQHARNSPGLRSSYQTAPNPRRRTRPSSYHRAASMARSPRKIGLRPVSTPPQNNPRPETSTSPCARQRQNPLRHAIR